MPLVHRSFRNAEEVLATMDEFTNHVADLRDIAEELKRLTNRFEVENK